MAWLNTPVAIIEDDNSIIERLTYMGATLVSYRRTITFVTTRYVGCHYNGAIAKRDALLLEYPPSAVLTAPTIEARVVAAGGGQYHVLATLKTISAWTLET